MARNEFLSMKTRTTGAVHDSSLTEQAGDWINATIMDIHKETFNRYLVVSDTFTPTVDQFGYDYSDLDGVTASSEVEKILVMRNQTNNRTLIKTTAPTVFNAEADPENRGSGVPAFFFERDQKFYLFKVPSAADTYAVDYKKRATDLTGDADIPDLPLEFTDVILLGAEARGLRYLRRSDWTQVWQVYKQEMARYIAMSADLGERLQFLRWGDGPLLPFPEIPLFVT